MGKRVNDSGLTESQQKILREGGTERAGSSELLHEKRSGIYRCVGCGNEVFSSETKFDSGSGWPSFWDAKKGAVKMKRDWSLRNEVMCAKCGGHLGHVFGDGPKPTGKRFCINGDVLEFGGE
jgi:peptide-methionine (R)-S-oxide reductase